MYGNWILRVADRPTDRPTVVVVAVAAATGAARLCSGDFLCFSSSRFRTRLLRLRLVWFTCTLQYIFVSELWQTKMTWGIIVGIKPPTKLRQRYCSVYDTPIGWKTIECADGLVQLNPRRLKLSTLTEKFNISQKQLTGQLSCEILKI